MSRVLTNATSLSSAIEASLGVAGSAWRLLEPNSIGSFGANITTAAPAPISRNRQRRKGFITDLTSAVEFETDIFLSSFRDFIEGFVFAQAVNRDVTQLPATAVVATGDTYTVAALVAAQADKLNVRTLLWAEGFTHADNNGLKSVDADIATSAVAISVSENLVDASPQTGRVSLAGYRILSSVSAAWVYSSTTKRATLTSTAVGTNAAAAGLSVGQFVHIGSVASVGAVIDNAFTKTASDDMFGYARVVSIVAGVIVFDKVSDALKDTDSATTTSIDIVFGEFIRNVEVGDSDYIERSFTMEAEYPGLKTGTTATPYRYSLGNFCNTVGFSLPLNDRATASFSFIGTDTGSPVAARKSGASTAAAPRQTARFNTTSDIARLRLADVDEAGLSTDFKSLSLTLGNNVSAENVLGTLGAKFINFGNFDVGIESQMLFTDGALLAAIRDNDTLSMDFILKGDDGAIAVDIPSLTLGGGGLDYPINESVLVNATAAAFEDATLGTSLGISIIPIPV